MAKQPAVYMLASNRNGTIYIGVTSNVMARTWQHREGLMEGFTKRHDVTRLIWYEQCDDISAAIQREKQLKKWNRAWKVRLIEERNPEWSDLWPGLAGN
ncbi:GIY-YIG nuclease family protein [Lysobacter soli]|uniref:GIY-YIG nuclease family protein n=1 Tax=Lysobacter soli TaxID=453783 RepID=UPI0020A08E32|nr:GIY-YIG nuclease family protein [Lysobacter soli]UTA52814.1 GIY-YIG nuclease family protein [Lysobacter soli]